MNYSLLARDRSVVAGRLRPCVINTGPGGRARDDLLVRVCAVNLGRISLLWSRAELLLQVSLKHLIGSLNKDFGHLGFEA